MDLFGSGYVIDHCIAALNADFENKSLKVYITDRLQNLVEGLAALGEVKIDLPRWIDLIETKDEKPQKSSTEIISDIKDKLKKYGGG